MTSRIKCEKIATERMNAASSFAHDPPLARAVSQKPAVAQITAPNVLWLRGNRRIQKVIPLWRGNDLCVLNPGK